MKTSNELKNVRTRETLTRHIYGLCNSTSGFALQNEFFAEWYLNAFPEKLTGYIVDGYFDDTYCEEWIGRFMRGTPSIHMDRQRLKAYINKCISWNGSKLRVYDSDEISEMRDESKISQMIEEENKRGDDDES